jgi:hypothetical protein
MTSPTDAKRLEELWRYSINYGPEGEDNYANVYAPDGILVGNLRTHHAAAIVERMNSFTSLKAERDRLREAVKPFVERAKHLAPETPDDFTAWHPAVGSAISAGDLRRVAALTPEPPHDK